MADTPHLDAVIVALHGNKGEPGYQLLHSPHPKVRSVANEIFERERKAGKSVKDAQAAIKRSGSHVAAHRKAGGDQVLVNERGEERPVVSGKGDNATSFGDTQPGRVTPPAAVVDTTEPSKTSGAADPAAAEPGGGAVSTAPPRRAPEGPRSPGGYRVGDRINVTVGGERYTVEVESFDEDIKNGLPGWDGTVVSAPPRDKDRVGSGMWGYDDQVTSVEPAPRAPAPPPPAPAPRAPAPTPRAAAPTPTPRAAGTPQASHADKLRAAEGYLDEARAILRRTQVARRTTAFASDGDIYLAEQRVREMEVRVEELRRGPAPEVTADDLRAWIQRLEDAEYGRSDDPRSASYAAGAGAERKRLSDLDFAKGLLRRAELGAAVHANIPPPPPAAPDDEQAAIKAYNAMVKRQGELARAGDKAGAIDAAKKAEALLKKYSDLMAAKNRAAVAARRAAQTKLTSETPLERLVRLSGPSTEERERLAAAGKAMPGGRYPIRDVSDLKKAIQASGRNASPAEFAKIKAWIKKRAKELGRADLIPDGW